MVDKFFKATYYVIISLVLISILYAVWASYTLVSQRSKSSEIIKVVKDIYQSQKSLTIDVIDLTKILIEDKNADIYLDVNNEEELVIEENQKVGLKEPLLRNENATNPLEIITEPFEIEQELADSEIDVLMEDSSYTSDNQPTPLEIITEPFEIEQELADSEIDVLMEDPSSTSDNKPSPLEIITEPFEIEQELADSEIDVLMEDPSSTSDNKPSPLEIITEPFEIEQDLNKIS